MMNSFQVIVHHVIIVNNSAAFFVFGSEYVYVIVNHLFYISTLSLVFKCIWFIIHPLLVLTTLCAQV